MTTEPSALPVTWDYGELQGSAHARYVLARNGNEYIIKGPAINPRHQHAAANEFVAARLAELLGIPTPDSRVLNYQGQRVFGRQWLQEPNLTLYVSADNFRSCVNRNDVYGVIVFDALLHNTDRHEGNVVVRQVTEKGKQPTTAFLAVDHCRCLVPPGVETSVLRSYVQERIPVTSRIGFLSQAVTDPALLSGALDMVECLGDRDFENLINSVPCEWWSDGTQGPQDVLDYLRQRRDALRRRFQQDRRHFVNLGEGEL